MGISQAYTMSQISGEKNITRAEMKIIATTIDVNIEAQFHQC